MRINNYLYPHPVLGLNRDYISDPIVDFSIDYDPNKLKFYVQFKILDIIKEFLDLLEEKKIKLICEVNCSETIYRHVFSSYKTELNFEIFDSDIKNKVEFQFIFLATEEIQNFTSSSFSEDRRNTSFDFEKGDITGILLTQAINVDTAGLSVSDFIRISENEINKHTIYDVDKNFIEIKLPKTQIEALRLLQNNPAFENILISALINPALIHALHFLKEGKEPEFENKAWFQLLKEKAFELLGKEYLEDPTEIVLLLDLILQHPNERLFSDLKNLTKK